MFCNHNERLCKYCSLKIISFGHVHHGKEKLRKGILQASKDINTCCKIWRKINQSANQACQILLIKIEEHVL